jgi:Cof subfamily protein (haloacid dehalogenase superfamily)
MSEIRPFEGKLLVSDMDRTLITDNFEVPRRNLEAIDRFIAEGGRFTLATGRIAASATKYLSKVGINAPAILSNGSSIYDFDSHKILWNTTLPSSAEELLQKVLERFPLVGAEVYSDEQIFIVNNNEGTRRHIINEGFKYRLTDVKSAPHGWQKILFADENARLREVDEFIRSIDHDGCDFVFSNTMYYEALPKGVTKGTALERLAAILGIAHKNTIGIGDYYNDLPLVKASGVGVTVAGAPRELIDAAAYVTGPCEGGAVADLIEYLEKTPELFGAYSIFS